AQSDYVEVTGEDDAMVVHNHLDTGTARAAPERRTRATPAPAAERPLDKARDPTRRRCTGGVHDLGLNEALRRLDAHDPRGLRLGSSLGVARLGRRGQPQRELSLPPGKRRRVDPFAPTEVRLSQPAGAPAIKSRAPITQCSSSNENLHLRLPVP